MVRWIVLNHLNLCPLHHQFFIIAINQPKTINGNKSTLKDLQSDKQILWLMIYLPPTQNSIQMIQETIWPVSQSHLVLLIPEIKFVSVTLTKKTFSNLAINQNFITVRKPLQQFVQMVLITQAQDHAWVVWILNLEKPFKFTLAPIQLQSHLLP